MLSLLITLSRLVTCYCYCYCCIVTVVLLLLLVVHSMLYYQSNIAIFVSPSVSYDALPARRVSRHWINQSINQSINPCSCCFDCWLIDLMRYCRTAFNCNHLFDRLIDWLNESIDVDLIVKYRHQLINRFVDGDTLLLMLLRSNCHSNCHSIDLIWFDLILVTNGVQIEDAFICSSLNVFEISSWIKLNQIESNQINWLISNCCCLIYLSLRLDWCDLLFQFNLIQINSNR